LGQLEHDILNGPPDYEDTGSTNPPSVEMSDIAEENDNIFHYEKDPFNLNSLEANQKQGNMCSSR